MTTTEFFENLENGATWSAGVAFKRSNPLPIDRYSVFQTDADARSYAKTNPVAYPGQLIAVVTDSGATAYIIREVGAADTVTDGGLIKLAYTTGDENVAKTIEKLQTKLDNLIKKVGTADISSVFPSGTAEDKQTVTNALLTLKAAVDSKISSVTAADKSVDVTTDANKAAKVKAKISTVTGNALSLKADSGKEGLYVPAQTNYTVTVETSNTSEGAAKSYIIKQLGKNIATIDIPKDMVVSDGVVEKLNTKPADFPTDQTFKAGMYIVLTIANSASSKLYIPSDGLVEYVTSGSKDTDAVVVAVSNDHKVTAKLTDKGVLKAKLSQDVQTSLGLADSALQKTDIKTGTSNGAISVKGTDVVVKGLGSAAYKSAVTSVTDTGTGLPTSKAIADYVSSMTAVYRYTKKA